MKFNFVAFLFFVFLLSACSVKPNKTSQQFDVEAQQVAIKKLKSWRMKGRLGFTNSQEKFSASVDWKQENDDYNIRLSKLGVTQLLAQGNASQALIEADGKSYQDTNATALIQRITGWTIPVEKMKKWVKGEASLSAEKSYNEQGLVASMSENCHACEGWQITYKDYRFTHNIWLPYSLHLKEVGGANSKIKIRISKWQLN